MACDDGKRVSFVIPCRDEDPEIVAATVYGLLATTHDRWREILVVDDCSDEPFDLQHPDVIVLRNREPLGSSRTRRRGLAACTGDVLVTCDSHMSFAPGWLETMLTHVDSRALLCAPWWDYEQHYPGSYGSYIGWGEERDWAAGTSPGFLYRHNTARETAAAVDVPMVIGACHMMRRDAYEQLGGYNPLFIHIGAEEQDLSARAWTCGFGVKCVTKARVGHLDRKGPAPYPSSFVGLEHNQLVLIRSLFDRATARLLEQSFLPLPEGVERSLAALDLAPWRARVRLHRRISDAEFFTRFVPDCPLVFDAGGRPSRRPSRP